MLKRLESMYPMAMPLAIDAIRAQIAAGIDIMVHIEKLEGGQRKVTDIVELVDYHEGKFCIESADAAGGGRLPRGDRKFPGAYQKIEAERRGACVKAMKKLPCRLKTSFASRSAR